jgi:hypothetical protein
MTLPMAGYADALSKRRPIQLAMQLDMLSGVGHHAISLFSLSEDTHMCISSMACRSY